MLSLSDVSIDQELLTDKLEGETKGRGLKLIQTPPSRTIHSTIKVIFNNIISYTCTPFSNMLNKNLNFWNTSVSSECCLHCDNTVYKSDSIISTEEKDDKCQTVETSVCRNLPGLDQATVEVEFYYKNCCNDQEGKD